jgi:pimeloyl-ACP methyl ester carboxylesterase
MAADEGVFIGQKIAFEQLIVPRWPVPRANESMEEYANRLANELNDADVQILGGASFGGIMAMHVAQYMKPQAVLLIGSAASPAELPRYARLARRLRPFVRFLPVRLLQIVATPLSATVFKKLIPGACGLAKQFVLCDPRVLKWSLEKILSWDVAPQVRVPVFHIHGDRDWILPLKNVSANRVVHGGGHLITLTHASQVNEYIREITTVCDASPTATNA